MSRQFYQTAGSTSKLDDLLHRTILSMGYNPDMAHSWTIQSTPENATKQRIVVVIDLNDGAKI